MITRRLQTAEICETRLAIHNALPQTRASGREDIT